MNKLPIVCTDRAHHERAALGAIRAEIGGLMVYVPGEGRRRSKYGAGAAGQWEHRADGGLTLVVTCPRCRRVARVRDENLLKMIGASLTELDISRLP